MLLPAVMVQVRPSAAKAYRRPRPRVLDYREA